MTGEAERPAPGLMVTLRRLSGNVVPGELRTTVEAGNPNGAWLVQPAGATYVVPAMRGDGEWIEVRWTENLRKARRRR